MVLIKFNTNASDQAHAVAWVNPAFVSLILPRTNAFGAFLEGCYVYTVGDDMPVSVKEDIDAVVKKIQEAQKELKKEDVV